MRVGLFLLFGFPEYLEGLIFNAMFPKGKNQSLPEGDYNRFLRSRVKLKKNWALKN